MVATNNTIKRIIFNGQIMSTGNYFLFEELPCLNDNQIPQTLNSFTNKNYFDKNFKLKDVFHIVTL